jgi:glutathione S-transferase
MRRISDNGAVATLYRCPTPTDWLCPCGKAARALSRHGIEHEQVRVPLRRDRRPEIEALTGQRRVPVLVIDGEVIADSKRIVENLEHRARAPAPASSDPGAAGRERSARP